MVICIRNNVKVDSITFGEMEKRELCAYTMSHGHVTKALLTGLMSYRLVWLGSSSRVAAADVTGD